MHAKYAIIDNGAERYFIEDLTEQIICLLFETLWGESDLSRDYTRFVIPAQQYHVVWILHSESKKADTSPQLTVCHGQRKCQGKAAAPGQHSYKAEDWYRHGSVTRAHDFGLAFENQGDSERQPVDELGGQQVAEIPRWWEVSNHQKHADETDRSENTSPRPSLGDLNSEICWISCLNCVSVRNIDLYGSTSFKISLMGSWKKFCNARNFPS
jgi:hypothetical protein